MAKKLSKLQMAQQKAEAAAKKTNQKINELGGHTSALYTSLTTIQSLFDRIRNVPEENMLKYEKLKAIRVNWKQQAEKIELEYQKAEVKAAGQGAAGVGAGVAVVALGPTAAMGIATTFGVASTGTAISALSGAAATNAALAWLGGGALAAGGGGMAAGYRYRPGPSGPRPRAADAGGGGFRTGASSGRGSPETGAGPAGHGGRIVVIRQTKNSGKAEIVKGFLPFFLDKAARILIIRDRCASGRETRAAIIRRQTAAASVKKGEPE